MGAFGHGPRVLVAVLGLATCAVAMCVVLLTGQAVPASLFLHDPTADPSVMTFGAAHWGSTRLPQDRSNPDDEISMRGSDSLTHSMLASHMGGVHLPEDTVGASRNERHVGEKINNAVRALDFVAGSAKGAPRHWLQPAAGNTGLRAISRNMAGELADNSAAALRQQSFRWALDDCKKESSCETLLGKKLFNVLQTRSGQPNLKIYHDQDDDRKEEERHMEHDYRAAAAVSEGGDGESQSRNRWQKLQGMMHTRWRASAPTARSVLKQIDQINAEMIPTAEKRILITTLMRKSRVARRAASLNDAYRSETSLIFPGSSKAHWNTYKASMMPAGEDSQEEMGEDLQQRARPSEADMLRKYQTKAANEMSGTSTRNRDSNGRVTVNGLASRGDSKDSISSAAQVQVAQWTKQASAMRHKLSDGSVSALRSKRVAGEKLRDAVDVQSTQDAIKDELTRYGSVFSGRADEDKLRSEEHVARAALRESRRRERRLQEERARQHDKVVAAEVKEAKTADDELASYDSAFVPHSRKGPSMAALGLFSGNSRGARGRGRRSSSRRDFRIPSTDRIPKDSAAMEEARDQRTAQEIAPMVQLAENTLESIGHMHTHSKRRERSRGEDQQEQGVHRAADGKCYLAGGKEVGCGELRELGNLMKKVYGSKAADVEIVSRDHSFDPTKVFADSSAAQNAEKRWMRIEGGGETHAARRRGGERRAEHGFSKERDEHSSSVGELLHEANEKAAEAQTKKVPVKKGSLAALSDNLGSIIGW